VIAVDANIFMYAAGAKHVHKGPSAHFLDRIAAGEVDAVVDAEVLQEILHRYRAIGRWSDGSHVFDLARRIVPTVIAVTGAVLDDAKQLLDSYGGLMARDALHVAAARHAGADAFCSFDRDFDIVRGFKRVRPQDVR
jgi:predicted nucleic acid-binding protein